MSIPSPCLAAAIILCAAPPVLAGSRVTLHNLPGSDLIVAQLRGPGLEPIRVSPCPMGRTHACCPGEAEPFGGRMVDSDGCPGPGRPPFEYWLEHGRTATFIWDDPGEEVNAEVYLHPGDGKAVQVCHGLLIYPPYAKVWPEPMD